jgi:hypothetical protein
MSTVRSKNPDRTPMYQFLCETKCVPEERKWHQPMGGTKPVVVGGITPASSYDREPFHGLYRISKQLSNR